MKKFSLGALAFTLLMLGAVSCQKDQLNQNKEVPLEVISKLEKLGFNPDGIEVIAEGYRIERDIIITPEFLSSTPATHTVPDAEQYSTNNLVNAANYGTISIYIPVETSGGGRGNKGTSGFSATYVAALDEAIARYNAENLTISFTRASQSNNADIVFTRLSKGEERQGILGSSGFPTASGDPYGEVKMSGILQSRYNIQQAGIATIMAHELGHCIGFRHTDYYDRSISCGGSPTDEGASSIGANQIPGTPATADLAGNGSWMLSCTNGSSRPFTPYDKVALAYLY